MGPLSASGVVAAALVSICDDRSSIAVLIDLLMHSDPWPWPMTTSRTAGRSRLPLQIMKPVCANTATGSMRSTGLNAVTSSAC